MKTLNQIHDIRASKKIEMDIRINENCITDKKEILICGGTGCTSSKSPIIIQNLKDKLKSENIQNVQVIQTGCFGLCAKGPIVIIRPEDVLYVIVKPEDADEIVEEHIKKGKIVERLLCHDIDETIVKKLDELHFIKNKIE